MILKPTHQNNNSQSETRYGMTFALAEDVSRHLTITLLRRGSNLKAPNTATLIAVMAVTALWAPETSCQNSLSRRLPLTNPSHLQAWIEALLDRTWRRCKHELVTRCMAMSTCICFGGLGAAHHSSVNGWIASSAMHLCCLL